VPVPCKATLGLAVPLCLSESERFCQLLSTDVDNLQLLVFNNTKLVPIHCYSGTDRMTNQQPLGLHTRGQPRLSTEGAAESLQEDDLSGQYTERITPTFAEGIVCNLQ